MCDWLSRVPIDSLVEPEDEMSSVSNSKIGVDRQPKISPKQMKDTENEHDDHAYLLQKEQRERRRRKS